MASKRASRTALRRRSRSERPSAGADLRGAILAALEKAGEPLVPKALAKRMRLAKQEWREFEQALPRISDPSVKKLFEGMRERHTRSVDRCNAVLGS